MEKRKDSPGVAMATAMVLVAAAIGCSRMSTEEEKASSIEMYDAIRRLSPPEFGARLLMCAQCNHGGYRTAFAEDCQRIYQVALERGVEIPPQQACD